MKLTQGFYAVSEILQCGIKLLGYFMNENNKSKLPTPLVLNLLNL